MTAIRMILRVFLFTLTAMSAQAQTRVIDGDTLKWRGETIRLLNMDAPEMGQICQDAAQRPYRCGEVAAGYLRQIIAHSDIICHGETRDAYGRLLAHCSADGRDLGAEMVIAGHALAFKRYSDEYLTQEVDAFKSGAGLWAGAFEAPWDFRAARWSAAQGQAPDGCPIKGNISAKGERIYHLPYSRHYAATQFSEAKGERWFCTEAEAVAAGWRPPLW